MTPRGRTIGVAVGLALFAGVLALPTPDGLPAAGHHVAAVAVLMAVWWVGNVLPMAATAMVPLIAFPLLGVSDLRAAAAPFAHPMIFLMLGGFVLGFAMEQVGLHRRLTALLLSADAVRRSPRRVLLALMATTATLSGLVSNTATMLMMLPLALDLADRCGLEERPRTGFVLALAYAASIGGTTTLVGTPPNAVFAGLTDIGFASWSLIGIPFALLALPLAWTVVGRLMIPDTSLSLPSPERPPWKPGEREVLVVVGVTMSLWLTRSVWGTAFEAKGVELDAIVAISAALVLLLLPGPDGFLVRWRPLEQALPWSVLLLLGGGFSLAAGIKASGLTGWLAGGAASLQDLPAPVVVAVIAGAMSGVTELTSNTASTQIALPLLEAAATRAGGDPMLWMTTATLSASCAFMMPVATAPNAIAAEAGGVDPRDMARCGVVLNVLVALLATAITLLLAPIALSGS